MLSTNNWRQKSASQMLQDLDPYLSQLPIISVNDISFSNSVLCSTFEIRKEYSVSGYPNLGKGFSLEEAKLSGLMESLEMCCVESLIPHEWYNPSIRPLIKTPGDITETSNIQLEAFLGNKKSIDINELFVQKRQRKVNNAKSLTNGLASGQFFDDSIVHSVYELIERHMIGSPIRIKVRLDHLSEELQSFVSQIESLGYACNIYIRGKYANTITIESHIVDNSLLTVDQPYGGFGFGCSGNANIAIARAISEAFQTLSMSKAIYLNSFGLGTDLTGQMNGYSKEINDIHNASLKLVPYILKYEELSNKNTDVSFSGCDSVHRYEQLIDDLESQGINQFNYIVLTKSDLPFVVVRCFIDQLSNSYGI